MKGIAEFLRTTVVGGFFVALPTALVVFLIAETVSLLGGVLEPLVAQLPIERLGGVELATLAALVLALAFCFAMGLVVRTGVGSRVNAWLEQVILGRLPGYELLRTLTRRLAGTEATARFAVALARLHDGGAQAFVFIVEQHENGDYTVFLPAAPTPTLGFVYYVREQDVQRLDVPMARAVNCIMQWGVGSRDLISAR